MDTVEEHTGGTNPNPSQEWVYQRPAMPDENRLEMPVQSLTKWSRSERRSWIHPALHHGSWLIRLFVFGGMLVLTAFGASLPGCWHRHLPSLESSQKSPTSRRRKRASVPICAGPSALLGPLYPPGEWPPRSQ